MTSTYDLTRCIKLRSSSLLSVPRKKMASTHDLTAKKLFNVENWVAVVTGGGTGIGLMCAQALAANGARVYITSRRKEKLTQSAHQHTPGSTGSIIPFAPPPLFPPELTPPSASSATSPTKSLSRS